MLNVILLCATELCVTAKFRDGFRAAWRNDDGAASAIVHLCVTMPVPESYNELAHWSFASVTNLTGNSTEYSNFQESWPDLIGETIYVPANTVGVIQVGKSEHPGSLSITNVPPSVEDVIIRARVKNYGRGHRMEVAFSNGVVTWANKPTSVSEVDEDYVIPATNASEITIRPTADRTLLQISDLRLVSGYQAPYTATNLLMTSEAGTRHTWSFRSLSLGDYAWRVETRFSDGSQPTFSPFCGVTLDPTLPPMPVGFFLRLR